jgi:four helix bundle protein
VKPTTKERITMFIAYEVALDAIRSLRTVVAAIAARDPALADQLRRAASGVPLQLAEGRRRKGADRTNRYRYASGSAAEAIAALDTALAWQLADEAALAEARAKLDRVVGLLWPLTK